MRGARIAAIGAVVVLTSVGVLGGSVGFAAADPTLNDSKSGDGLARFQEQPVDWRRCQLDAKDELGKVLDEAKAQCAEVIVPLDYSAPEGRTITVAISRLKATDPAKRRGVLMTNPGGPGGEGLILPLFLAEGGSASAAVYDMIGMDPRFVGRSTPINCAWPTLVGLHSAGPDRRSFAQSVAFAKDRAARCQRTNEDVLPYASTRNTVRDLDIIRAALGEEKMSYFGGSYGTYLGAVYLQLFPEKADRFVLDSAVDPNVYGPGLLSRNNAAMTAALKSWAAWAARHHKKYRLGATAGQVLTTVERIRKTADRRPLKVGTFTIDNHLLPLLLWASDDHEESYAELAAGARVLRDASRGIKVTLTPSMKQSLTEYFSPDVTGFVSVQMAILCADRAVSRDPQTYYRDIQAHRSTEPLYGPLIRNITPCAFWPATPAEPTTQIGNDAPALILNTTGDTQTPYPGAQVMHQALTGSRLVTLKNAYRHGVYLGGSSCADAAVDRYLLDGVLPGSDLTCTEDKKTAKVSSITPPVHPLTVLGR